MGGGGHPSTMWRGPTPEALRPTSSGEAALAEGGYVGDISKRGNEERSFWGDTKWSRHHITQGYRVPTGCSLFLLSFPTLILQPPLQGHSGKTSLLIVSHTHTLSVFPFASFFLLPGMLSPLSVHLPHPASQAPVLSVNLLLAVAKAS